MFAKTHALSRCCMSCKNYKSLNFVREHMLSQTVWTSTRWLKLRKISLTPFLLCSYLREAACFVAWPLRTVSLWLSQSILVTFMESFSIRNNNKNELIAPWFQRSSVRYLLFSLPFRCACWLYGCKFSSCLFVRSVCGCCLFRFTMKHTHKNTIQPYRITNLNFQNDFWYLSNNGSFG